METMNPKQLGTTENKDLPYEETCQLCNKPTGSTAIDAATFSGQWAWLCSECATLLVITYGTGKGQEFCSSCGIKLRG